MPRFVPLRSVEPNNALEICMSAVCCFRKILAVLRLALVAAVGVGGLQAAAAPVISGFNFTGASIPVGQGGQDTSWMVEAWPVDAPNQPATPYPAWVFSGTGTADDNVPGPWYPGPPTGRTNPRVSGGRWIGLNENNATSVLPDSFGPTVGTYTTVYSTTFVSSEAGTAFLWLKAAADNAVTFFVNGTVTGRDTNQPTITGGSQVGARAQGLSTLKLVTGFVPVVAGSNTLYAVVEDRFGSTNTYAYTGVIVVPEPSTYAYAGVAACGLALAGLKRRNRRPAA